MRCYCSNCLGLKDFSRRRTVQDHLAADVVALQHCSVGREELRAHYQSCIRKNEHVLASAAPLQGQEGPASASYIVGSAVESGSDGRSMTSESSESSSDDESKSGENENSSDVLMESINLPSAHEEDMDLDVGGMKPRTSSQLPSNAMDSDVSDDTEDEMSEAWWQEAAHDIGDGGAGAESSESSDEPESDSEGDDMDGSLGGNPASAVGAQPATTENSQTGDFLNLPASVAKLRAKLLGDYRLPPTPPETTHAGPRPLSPSEYWTLKHYTAWSLTNGTVKAYKAHARNLEESSGTQILESRQAEKLAQSLADFYPQTVDMCPYSCIAYTGDYEGLRNCPEKRRKDPEKRTKTVCNEPRYRTSSKGRLKPRATVQLLSPFPRIRAMFAKADTSELIRRRDACLQQALHVVGTAVTKTYSDFADGQVHALHYTQMGLFQDPRDIAFALSTDGAQLTMKKQSNTWLMILILLNLPPSIRYETGNVIIVFATPGPHSPIDVESFLWTLFKDMAMASEGIWMWDALDSSYFVHRAHVVMGLGDMLGSAKLSGMAGHNAVHGDRFTRVQGARSSLKPNAKYQYYPTQPPDNARYNPQRPAEYDLHNLPMRTQESYWKTLESLDNARTKTQQEEITRSTGVSRRPLCAASAAFLHPTFFPLDPFHLCYENCMAYIWDLWTTTSKPGEVIHLSSARAAEVGKLIPLAMATLPPTFCGPVRDVNLKRQSQYKIYEWMALLHWYLVPIAVELNFDPSVLQNFARFVEIIEYAMTNRPRTDQDLDAFRSRIALFLQGFERLYVGDNPENIQRARLCIFQLIHIPHHIKWNGSVRLGSQATVERGIGEMGHKIRSRKAPFANLSKLIFRRELIKVLLLLYPNLEPNTAPNDRLGQSINRSRLLQKHRIAWTKVHENLGLQTDIAAISDYLGIDVQERREDSDLELTRWGKFILPNGRTVSSQLSGERSQATRRSEWIEITRSRDHMGSDLFLSQFGEVRAFYRVGFPDNSFRSLVVYNPLENVENILNFPRGNWNGARICVRDVYEIRDIVGIWNGSATGLVYILRKHPGLDMLSPDECGLESSGEEEEPDDIDI